MSISFINENSHDNCCIWNQNMKILSPFGKEIEEKILLREVGGRDFIPALYGYSVPKRFREIVGVILILFLKICD
jgi:hypothetical protein